MLLLSLSRFLSRLPLLIRRPLPPITPPTTGGNIDFRHYHGCDFVHSWRHCRGCILHLVMGERERNSCPALLLFCNPQQWQPINAYKNTPEVTKRTITYCTSIPAHPRTNYSLVLRAHRDTNSLYSGVVWPVDDRLCPYVFVRTSTTRVWLVLYVHAVVYIQ